MISGSSPSSLRYPPIPPVKFTKINITPFLPLLKKYMFCLSFSKIPCLIHASLTVPAFLFCPSTLVVVLSPFHMLTSYLFLIKSLHSIRLLLYLFNGQGRSTRGWKNLRARQTFLSPRRTSNDPSFP